MTHPTRIIILNLACSNYFCALPLNADVFAGPTTSLNRLVVAVNETVVFTPLSESFFSAGLVTNGKTNDVEFIPCCQDHAIAGPAELVLRDSRVLNYVRLQTNAVHSLIIPTASTSNIVVPSGRTARFFAAMASNNGATRVRIQTSTGTETIDGTAIYWRETAGPTTVEITTLGSGDINASQFSYFFTDEFTISPDVLPRFTFGDGNLEVTIETSTNLTQWAPHYVLRTSDVGTNFFRLTIRKK